MKNILNLPLMRLGHRWAALAAAAPLAVLTLLYLGHPEDKKNIPGAAALRASRTTITRSITASGVIKPRNQVNLKSRISGVLEKFFVRPGRRVHAGQRIAAVRLLPEPVMLNAAESQLLGARISAENQEQEFARAEELFRRKLISDEEFQRARTARDLRNTELTAAKNQVQLLKGGSLTGEDGDSNLVRATIDGVVIDQPISPGQYVSESNSLNAGTTISVLADITQLMFKGEVSEADVNDLHEGMAVLVVVSALKNVELQGRLTYIAPQGALKDGTVKFEIHAPLSRPEGGLLRPGFSATAEIMIDRREHVVAIPESALRFDDTHEPYVVVMEPGGSTRAQTVTPGLSDGFMREIVQGLNENDAVLAEEEE